MHDRPALDHHDELLFLEFPQVAAQRHLGYAELGGGTADVQPVGLEHFEYFAMAGMHLP